MCNSDDGHDDYPIDDFLDKYWDDDQIALRISNYLKNRFNITQNIVLKRKYEENANYRKFEVQ